MATRQAAATATFPAAEAAAAARPHRKEEVPAALIPTKNDWRAQKTPTFCCSYKAANETDRRVPVNNLIFVTAHQGKSDHVIVGDAPNRRANAGKSPPARAHPECRPSSTHGRRGSAGEDGVILGPCTSQEVELVVCAKSTLADGERAIPAVLRANEQEVGQAVQREVGQAKKNQVMGKQVGCLSIRLARAGRGWAGLDRTGVDRRLVLWLYYRQACKRESTQNREFLRVCDLSVSPAIDTQTGMAYPTTSTTTTNNLPVGRRLHSSSAHQRQSVKPPAQASKSPTHPIPFTAGRLARRSQPPAFRLHRERDRRRRVSAWYSSLLHTSTHFRRAQRKVEAREGERRKAR
ncbi:hypothetical protein BKA81DRAFT_381018 [Phyllosticta paracitricarpa]